DAFDATDQILPILERALGALVEHPLGDRRADPWHRLQFGARRLVGIDRRREDERGEQGQRGDEQTSPHRTRQPTRPRVACTSLRVGRRGAGATRCARLPAPVAWRRAVARHATARRARAPAATPPRTTPAAATRPGTPSARTAHAT